jgi:hypothetical protein
VLDTGWISKLCRALSIMLPDSWLLFSYVWCGDQRVQRG